MSGDNRHVALSNTGGSGGLRRFGHSARRYCTVAGVIISGHHNLQHLQKTMLMGSTLILRRVVSSF